MEVKCGGLITPTLPLSIPSLRANFSDKLTALEEINPYWSNMLTQHFIVGLNSFTVHKSLHVFLFSRSVINLVF